MKKYIRKRLDDRHRVRNRRESGIPVAEQAKQGFAVFQHSFHRHVSAVDLNGAGKADLVLTVVAQSGAVILLGNGHGTFQPNVTYTAGRYPFAFATQDVNGDGNVGAPAKRAGC